MRKILLSSFLALVIGGAAEASVSPYAAVRLGVNQLNGDFSDDFFGPSNMHQTNGWLGQVAAGAAFQANDWVGLRGELSYEFSRANRVGDGSTNLNDNRVLASVFVDFGGRNWGGFNPFIGLHGGYTFGTLHSPVGHEEAKGQTYGASIGVSYAIDSSMTVDFTVRHLMTDRDGHDAQFSENFRMSNNETSALLGLRLSF